MIGALIFLLGACGGSDQAEDSPREWCRLKTDSLWTQLNETRKNFNYKMDEIAQRREDMDSFFIVLRHLEVPMDKETQTLLTQYNSVLTVYKTITEDYKSVVLEGEEIFYRVKALDRSVKKGDYDEKIEEFKKTWQELKMDVIRNSGRTHIVSAKLDAIEPMYQRIQPRIDKLREKWGMD